MAQLPSSKLPTFAPTNILFDKFMPTFLGRIEEAKHRYNSLLRANASSGNGGVDLDFGVRILDDLFGQTVMDMTAVLQQGGDLEKGKLPPRPNDIITVEDDEAQEEKVEVDDHRNGGGHHLEASAQERQNREVVKQKIPNITTTTMNDDVAGGSSTASGGGSGQIFDVPEGRPNQKKKEKKVLVSPGDRGSSSRRAKAKLSATATTSDDLPKFKVEDAEDIGAVPNSGQESNVTSNAIEVPLVPETLATGQTVILQNSSSTSSFSMSLRPRSTTPIYVRRSSKKRRIADGGDGGQKAAAGPSGVGPSAGDGGQTSGGGGQHSMVKP